MKIIFALLLIIFLAFSGYHLSFRGLKLPLFARQFYLTGTEFLFLGLLLGPQFLNLFDRETQKGLAPLTALLLGWIGLLYGSQFEIAKLRRFPLEYLVVAILEGLLTLTLVFLAAYFTLPLFLHIPTPMKVVVALALAAAAACTAQTGLALMTPEAVSRRQNTLMFLRYISSIDGLSALVIFGLAFIFRQSSVSALPWVWELSRGIVISLGASVGLLFLFTLFLKKRIPESELILVVIGMAIVTSGTASVLNFSPLLASFFVGFWLVNISHERERICRVLITVEKPVYLLLLLFLGVGWQIDSVWIIFLAAGYWLWRSVGKILAGFLITQVIPGLRTHPRHLGFGLLDQGGLPLAVLLDFSQSFPCDTTTRVISLALIAVIYNDFLSPHFLKRLLQREPR
jgi:hypothetical protein